MMDRESLCFGRLERTSLLCPSSICGTSPSPGTCRSGSERQHWPWGGVGFITTAMTLSTNVSISASIWRVILYTSDEMSNTILFLETLSDPSGFPGELCRREVVSFTYSDIHHTAQAASIHASAASL